MTLTSLGSPHRVLYMCGIAQLAILGTDVFICVCVGQHVHTCMAVILPLLKYSSTLTELLSHQQLE